MVVWDTAVCGVHTTMGSANWEEIRFGVVPCWVDHRRRKEKKKIGAVGGIWQRWIKMYTTHGGSKESCCCVECVFYFYYFFGCARAASRFLSFAHDLSSKLFFHRRDDEVATAEAGADRAGSSGFLGSAPARFLLHCR